MIVRAENLTPEQKAAFESLFGRPIASERSFSSTLTNARARSCPPPLRTKNGGMGWKRTFVKETQRAPNRNQ